jgi:U4/U6.U5 tri-snRNP-associated protein 3
MARMRADIAAEERGTAPSTANGNGESSNQKSNNQHKNDATESDDEEIDDEQRQMMQMMGFGGFGTTKGKSVGDNQTSAARGAAAKNKGRKYRQYMNRKGGFNRPLDKMT